MDVFPEVHQLMRSPLDFTHILDEIPLGIMVMDTDLRVVYLNQFFQALTGFSLDIAKGIPCKNILRSSACILNCPVLATHRKNRSISCTSDIINTDRQKLPVRITTAQITDTLGHFTGYMETIEDMRSSATNDPEKNVAYSFANIIGRSRKMETIFQTLPMLAQSDTSILITGETGTGKDLVAEAIHQTSGRADGPFIKINCGALPETLLESELYGYEKGAFTGAHKKRPGKFLTADKGVLFLDEIGDMPLALQSKMLHVLQSGEFSPLGSDEDFKTDVWVIAATNHNLEESMRKKAFREDLFYRLNIIKIEIPPLRERREDIPALIEYYFRMYKTEYPNNNGTKPDSHILERLCSYPWPGNVRQLQNCIKKQMVLNSWDKIFEELPWESSQDIVHDTQVPPSSLNQFHSEVNNDRLKIISEFVDLSTSSEKLFEDISLKKIKKLASDKVEKEVITFVLEKVGWNRSRASKILKVSYKTLLYKMSEFDVSPPVK